MQHLACRLNERIKEVKSEMTRWLEDVMKRTYEVGHKTNTDLQQKFGELLRQQNKDRDKADAHIERLGTNMLKYKKEGIETKEQLQKNLLEI